MRLFLIGTQPDQLPPGLRLLLALLASFRLLHLDSHLTKTNKANPNPIITRHPGRHRVPQHPQGRVQRAAAPQPPRTPGAPTAPPLPFVRRRKTLPRPRLPAASPPLSPRPHPAGPLPARRGPSRGSEPGRSPSVRCLPWSGAGAAGETRGCGAPAARPVPAPLTPAPRPGRLLSTDIAPSADAAGAGPRAHWPARRGGRVFRRPPQSRAAPAGAPMLPVRSRCTPPVGKSEATEGLRGGDAHAAILDKGRHLGCGRARRRDGASAAIFVTGRSVPSARAVCTGSVLRSFQRSHRLKSCCS